MQSIAFNIYPLGEQALTLSFGNSISDAILLQVSALHRAIRQNPFPGLIDMVPAYATLTLFYDVVTVRQSALPGNNALEQVGNYVRSLKVDENITKTTTRKIEIPVCYGGPCGPDLIDLAAMHQLSVEKVIQLHSKAVYRVFMMGFVPGFAYLGGMDKQLATARRATPRKVIPAGSVGIAGEQTGVYPLETPGGWQLIGRTPLRLFDAGRTEPSLLQAGDEVHFKPISEAEYHQYINH